MCKLGVSGGPARNSVKRNQGRFVSFEDAIRRGAFLWVDKGKAGMPGRCYVFHIGVNCGERAARAEGRTREVSHQVAKAS